MDNMTRFAIHVVREQFKWDFYRIELLQKSAAYEELIEYLKSHQLDYVEDVEFGGAIVIFRDLRSDGSNLRKEILEKFGENEYFAMEGNMTLMESALYATYRQIQSKQEEES